MPRVQMGTAYVLISVILVSFAQLALRNALMDLPADLASAFPLNPSGYVALTWLLGGCLAYLLSFACWITGLRTVPLHQAYPLLGLSYPLVYLLAVSIDRFQETVSPIAGLGVLVVSLGVYLIGTASPSEES
jgi:undecaprenyl phosphate-alpha-L-ara4N flippase subunit ArnF